MSKKMDSSKSRANLPLVQQHLEKALSEGLGLDLTDSNLKDTPERIARMYCNEFFRNVGVEFPAEELTSFDIDDEPETAHISDYGMVLFDNIPYVSTCSHHFLPFSGLAWFLYIPDEVLVGASKPSRLINHYAARPQLQERLGREVVNRFVDVVEPKGAMLVMRAVHGCMSCRGVKNGNRSGMTTSVLYGGFEDHKTRSEAMQLIMLSVNTGV